MLAELRHQKAVTDLRSENYNADNSFLNNNYGIFDQAHYAAAVALNNNPVTKFNGDPLEFVRFISMLQNTYEFAIFDSPTLYSVLQKHLYGNAASIIDSCNYLGKENRYKAAIQKLAEMYGNKASVIKAHRKKMLSGLKVGNNLADFSKFKTELDCFKKHS